MARGSTDARIHLDRVSRAVGDAKPDEVWGALIDLFLLFDTNSAGIRGRALFWGRPLLTDDQHQFLADHLHGGLAWSSPVLPKPKRSLHWRGVVGRQVVDAETQEGPLPEFAGTTDVRAALGRLLEPITSEAPPESLPDGPPPPTIQPGSGAEQRVPRVQERPAPAPSVGRVADPTPASGRSLAADPRVQAALKGRAADTPLKGDENPQQHTEPTLADSVSALFDMVADDREARALVGPGGSLQFHPDRTVDVGLSEIQLSAWCEPPQRPSELKVRPVESTARGHRILTWSQLRWELGSRCAAGSFPSGLNLEAALVLREVPDLGTLRRLPGDHTVLTRLRDSPATIAEIRDEGVELRHLAALVGALWSLGVLSHDPRLHLVTNQHDGIADTQLTWFERLRSGLIEW